jgi:glutaredoxin 3
MSKIEIYTTPVCPFCVRAKKFLKEKGYTDFIEIDVSVSDYKKNAMITRAGGRKTVPQIFINDIHIGGYEDLILMDRAGTLETILNKPEV